MSDDQQVSDDQLTFDDAVGKWQREGQSVTSLIAAYEAVPVTGKSRIAVYEMIKAHGNYGATDEEIQAALDMNPSTQRPRRVELVDQGLIKDSGRTRTTRSRRQAVVWVKV